MSPSRAICRPAEKVANNGFFCCFFFAAHPMSRQGTCLSFFSAKRAFGMYFNWPEGKTLCVNMHELRACLQSTEAICRSYRKLPQVYFKGYVNNLRRLAKRRQQKRHQVSGVCSWGIPTHCWGATSDCVFSLPTSGVVHLITSPSLLSSPAWTSWTLLLPNPISCR